MKGFLACLLVCMTLSLATPSRAEERFEFHSDSWLNLHHLLYHQARAERLGSERLRGRVAIREQDKRVVLGAEEQSTWEAALDAYAMIGRKDLLFDAEMRQLREIIARGETAIGAASLDEPVLQALVDAMPVYREHWWEQHDALNRALIETLQTQLAEHGNAVADYLAETYESRWPDSPIRVDASVYAISQGAYTHNNPNHIVMASADERHQSLLALEILFHEAGHTSPLGERLFATARTAAETAGVDPGMLWHSYIFYASGEAIRSVASEDHTRYADAQELWQRGPLARDKRLLDACFDKGTLSEQFACMYMSSKTTDMVNRLSQPK